MNKTNYVREIVDSYCVLDVETTGLSPYLDNIIEVSILKVENNQIIDTYSQLVDPEITLDDFIINLTGIDNNMLVNMPKIYEIESEVLNFIGTDIIVGHHTSFDIRFLSQNFKEEVNNKYIDTIQFSRKLYPELRNYKLSTLTEYLNLHENTHRSLDDCISTKELYDRIKNDMKEKNLTIQDLWKKSYKSRSKLDLTSIYPENENIDEDNFFFNKHIVFTGKLETMTRKEACQLVVNKGGILDNSVCKKTNYLILGNNDYNKSIKDGKSVKQKKAENLKLNGQDIDIIDEQTFYDLINE